MAVAMLVKAVVGLSLFARVVKAYIPAVAVNDTSSLVNSNDLIHIAWQPNGVFSTGLSRQLVADSIDGDGDYTNVSTIVPWSKYSKGVLIHFTEAMAGQQPSVVPWIAMINCDTNGTVYTLDVDIFTIARDHGAQAALLYSPTSAGCLMNTEYLVKYQKVLDVYATLSVQGARLIESQFDNVGASAFDFDSQMLNASSVAINVLLASDPLYVEGGNIPEPVQPGANVTDDATGMNATSSPTSVDGGLYSTDTAAASTAAANATSSTASSTNWITVTSKPRRAIDWNDIQGGINLPTPTELIRRQMASTVSSALASSTTRGANYLAAVMASANLTVGRSASASAPSPTPSGSQRNTSVAMIILYSITGLVTALFLVVILSGAIRAVRHPERYGPRAAGYTDEDGHRQPQSRAHGLTRAILDTFPVVKFGRTDQNAQSVDDGGSEGPKDIEMNQRVSVLEADGGRMSTSSEAIQQSRAAAESSSADQGPDANVVSSAEETGDASLAIHPQDVDDATTCPICVCEFEQGENIRILPCDGRHRFHCDCIDPWLLQVSSLCPLCRLDLSTDPRGARTSQDNQDRGHGDGQAVPDEDDEEAQERQVISNLRAMLPGHRRSSTAARLSLSQNGAHATNDALSQSGGRRRSSSAREGSEQGAGTARPTSNGAAVARLAARNRFFRYVASRRRQRGTE